MSRKWLTAWTICDDRIRPGPVGDKGRGDASFVHPPFEQTERGVAGVRPGQIVALERVGGSRAHARDVADDHLPALTRREVVPERPGPVGVLGEELGAPPLSDSKSTRAPCSGFRPLGASMIRPTPRSIRSIWAAQTAMRRSSQRFSRMSDQGGAGGSRAEIAHLESSSPPALSSSRRRVRTRSHPQRYSPLVARDVLFAGVQGPVGRRAGNVQKERLAAGAVLLDPVDGVVADGIRDVVVVPLRFDPGVLHHQDPGIEVAPSASQHPVEAIETSLPRRREARLAGTPALGSPRIIVAPDVPLSGHEGGAASGPQRLGDGEAPVVEKALVGRSPHVVHPVTDSGMMRIQPRAERGARRTAARAVVHLAEPRAAGGQAVDVRRADLGSVVSRIREPHVVGQDQHDVRTAGLQWFTHGLLVGRSTGRRPRFPHYGR